MALAKVSMRTLRRRCLIEPLPGELTLRNLVLKRGALDKFRLPIDVVEGAGSRPDHRHVRSWQAWEHAGHLGKFSLSLHWMNLGNQPVQVLVEDVYLLVVPSPASNDDPAEEEKRAQAAKMDRVKNAELLHFRGAPEKGKMFCFFPYTYWHTECTDEGAQSQGLVGSLIAKILNNLQVTVKNVHVRYEDQMSVPDVSPPPTGHF
jgi:vacuolar protein sorting-associated protein 13A/C